ncbi:hypothetical protein KIPB_011219, partial [Kipferlia bialata]|eukprot:g11219.t1
MQQAMFMTVPVAVVRDGVQSGLDLHSLGFVPHGKDLLVKWPYFTPPPLGEGEREWVEGPSQSDLDTLLRDTPFAPTADRTGRLHRVFLPDHDVYLETTTAFIAYNFEDDPIMNLMYMEQTARMATEMTLVRQGNLRSARYGGLWTLIPEGNLPTQPSAALMGAAPGYFKQVTHIPALKLLREVVRGPEVRQSVGALGEIHTKHDKYTDENHFYVYFICASPMLRGKGIGSILMNKAKVLCDMSSPSSLPLHP